jgi:uncharacterized phage protein gp47/JayE
MASTDADVIYRDRDTIISDLAAALLARIPDANLTPDSIWRIWIETISVTMEGLFLANQLLHNDMFIQTASGSTLIRFGEMYGRSLKAGTRSTGTLRFSGAGGTVVAAETQAAAPGAGDEALLFNVSVGGTIPNPGIPGAPTAADGGAGVLPAGTYSYAVSFVTNEGETEIGSPSGGLVLAASHQVNLTALPVGGPGTIARRIYRSVGAGPFALVTTVNDNSTLTYTDNTATAVGAPLDDSTAEAISLAAESDDEGAEYNVAIGTVTTIVSAVPGIVDVTNTSSFVGASDPEDIEQYRSDLLTWVRAPQSGSLYDLETWAETVSGVESATAIQNDNLGTTVPGHVTVRITGPGGIVPAQDVIDATLAELISHDLANIVIHVGTFTAQAIAVTVTVTRQTGYLLADISAAVTNAISDYITSVPVGGTVYVAGIVDAVFGLPGVATLVVNTPASDTTVTATQKPTPGVITIQ